MDETLGLIVAIPVLAIVLIVLGTPLIVFAIVDYRTTRSHLVSRSLLVSLVNGIVQALIFVAGAAAIASGIGDENAGDVLVLLAFMGLIVGGGGGGIVSLAAIIIGCVVVRRKQRVTRQDAPEWSGPGKLSRTLAVCSILLGLLAVGLLPVVLNIHPVTWLTEVVLVVPGLIMGIGTLAGRRWICGIAALVLNVIPMLVFGGYFAYTLPQSEHTESHPARVVDKGVLEDQLGLAPFRMRGDETLEGMTIVFTQCDDDFQVRLTPLRDDLNDTVSPSPQLRQCLDRMQVGDVVEVQFVVGEGRFTGEYSSSRISSVGGCEIPERHKSTIISLMHCPIWR